MNNVLNRIGFTLVELLVVIAIIGVLASVLLVNFNAARENARDQVRTTDLKQLQLAIELYKAQNGRYPDSGCAGAANTFYGPGPGPNGTVPSVTGNYTECDDWIVGLAPDLIAELPSDPASESEPGRGFYYRSNGESYKILIKHAVERNFITSYNQEFARCPRPSGNNYCSAGTSPASGGGRDDTYAIYSSGAAERW